MVAQDTDGDPEEERQRLAGSAMVLEETKELKMLGMQAGATKMVEDGAFSSLLQGHPSIPVSFKTELHHVACKVLREEIGKVGLELKQCM